MSRKYETMCFVLLCFPSNWYGMWREKMRWLSIFLFVLSKCKTQNSGCPPRLAEFLVWVFSHWGHKRIDVRLVSFYLRWATQEVTLTLIPSVRLCVTKSEKFQWCFKKVLMDVWILTGVSRMFQGYFKEGRFKKAPVKFLWNFKGVSRKYHRCIFFLGKGKTNDH